MNKKILITGCAGFIGYHLSKFFLEKNFLIYGVDKITNNYNKKLKQFRLNSLKTHKNFSFYKLDVCKVNDLLYFSKINFGTIFHFAAQPGVLLSMKKPNLYYRRNIIGFQNILDIALKNKSNFFFASSSSIYGNQKSKQLNEKMVANPNSIYGLTKLTNEYTAKILTNGLINSYALRFFTVYGPYGRPDMAIYKFTKNLIENKKIILRNNGNFYRDFTYIDDVVKAIYKLFLYSNKNLNSKHFLTLNMGFGKPIKITKLVSKLEKHLNKIGKIEKNPINNNEVLVTHSSSKKLFKIIPSFKLTTIDKGLKKFIDWYKEYTL